MNRCKIIMVTSAKGGVGKTTITANLAMALTRSGKKVLALDLDLSSRCLDLVMGLENNIVYDIGDVLDTIVPLDKAVINDQRCENLFFCAAPSPLRYTEVLVADMSGSGAEGIREDNAEYSKNRSEDGQHGFYNSSRETGKHLKSILNEFASAHSLDYILIDTPGTLGKEFEIATFCADMAIAVSTHQPAAIRATELTFRRLESLGIDKCRLIINFFDCDGVIDRIVPGAADIIDRTSIQLLGIIPEDKLFSDMQQTGALIDSFEKTNSAAAFRNIAKRLNGQNIPIFSGFKGVSKYVLRR